MYRVEAQGSGFGGTRQAIHVLARIAGKIGKRRTVKTLSALYQAGDTAQHYFLVESGMFGLFDPVKGRRRPVCFMRAGDLFAFNCGDLHALSCQAAVDSVVISLDRAALARIAAEEPEVAALLKTLHADELSMILRALSARRRVRWSEACSVAVLGERLALKKKEAGSGVSAANRSVSSAVAITGGMAA